MRTAKKEPGSKRSGSEMGPGDKARRDRNAVRWVMRDQILKDYCDKEGSFRLQAIGRFTQPTHFCLLTPFIVTSGDPEQHKEIWI